MRAKAGQMAISSLTETVTVKGKLVTRDGISMIENAEITQ
jgi:hypothetical protein